MHAHFASGGRSAMALARSLRVPLVVTLHGADVTVKGAGQRYKELMEAASAFICVSEFIRSKALAAGFPASKLIVHYIGVDRSLFVPADGAASRGVLFVGRFVEKKGCEFLVRAMQSVQRVYPDAELTMIGDGPLRPQHEALARELGVRSKFLGILPSTLVREHLRQACIFCAPSVTSSNGDSEGLPTVLAEAQASGIPVVATKHAGIPEIIEDGGNGILVDERNAVKLAEALMLLFRDDALYRRFREAGIQNVEQRFDLITQTARLEQIYDSVLK
jgi:glycosyltransferase involved in cell wall biosynthesis